MYMINGMILILILLIFRSLMAMSLNVPLMVYIHVYLNFFALPEHLRMLQWQTDKIKSFMDILCLSNRFFLISEKRSIRLKM